jgi:hypothetical protein
MLVRARAGKRPGRDVDATRMGAADFQTLDWKLSFSVPVFRNACVLHPLSYYRVAVMHGAKPFIRD